MGLRAGLGRLLDKVQVRGAETTERVARARHNVDLVLAHALEAAARDGPLLYPVDYVHLLRQCLETSRRPWREIRSSADDTADAPGRRFASLIATLDNLPPVEFDSAERLARVADAHRGNVNPADGRREYPLLYWGFTVASSLGFKGRLLNTIVRYTESRQIVELGTAWGMSAMFMLEALRLAGEGARLTTVESLEWRYARSAPLLRARYGDLVCSELGRVEDLLPRLAARPVHVDFLFHDAGHSGEAFQRDFAAALPMLAPGAVVLFDDIKWYDRTVVREDPRCYEGWRQVALHPRVRRAVEISDSMGLILLS